MPESDRLGVQLSPSGNKSDLVVESCVFCRIVKGELPSYKVYEDEKVFAFLDINPICEGHTLVIPKEHYENIFEIPDDLLGMVMSAAKRLSVRYKDRMSLDGVNILSSNGKAAQQDVFHLHVHIIPRKENDGHTISIQNFGKDGKELKTVWERLKS